MCPEGQILVISEALLCSSGVSLNFSISSSSAHRLETPGWAPSPPVPQLSAPPTQNRMWVSGGEGECGVGVGSGLRTQLPEA